MEHLPQGIDEHRLVFWTYAFMVSAYVMAATCLYRGVRAGYRDAGGAGVVRELCVFGAMALILWFVESWAHFGAPYYGYPPSFSDLIPRIDFKAYGLKERFAPTMCTDTVTGLHQENGRIPLSVIMLEASLVYAAMWTARRVTKNLALQPLLAGIGILSIDLLLDPVVASTHDCQGGLRATGGGVGLWQWYLPTENQLCNGQNAGSCPERMVAHLFDIPIFNFAAWLGAPIMTIAFINIFPWLRKELRPLGKRVRDMRIGQLPGVHWSSEALAQPLPAERAEPKGIWAGGLLTMIVVIALVLYSAPTVSQNNPEGQYAALGIGLAAALILLLLYLRPDRLDWRVDPALVLPAVLALLVGSISALFSNRFVVLPWLIPVAVVASVLVLAVHWLPYGAAIRRFAKLIAMLDRLMRLHYFGFTAMLILLGAAGLDESPSTAKIAGLLLVALCFHIYSYVVNDLVDLELDRQQPLRQDDPLVREDVGQPQALGLALACIPVGFFTLLHLVEFDPKRMPLVLGSFAGGLALMAVYNVYGKRIAWPMITDLLQGIAWGALALIGAAVVNHELAVQLFWERPFPLIAYGTLYIMLISGVHGGLRDVATDSKCEKRTTAILLGATARKGGRENESVSNGRIAVYAHVLHTLLFGSLVLFIALNAAQSSAQKMFQGATLTGVIVVLAVLFALAFGALCMVVGRDDPAPSRRDWIGWHALWLMLPPLFVFAVADGPVLAFKVTVVACVFVPLLFAEWAHAPLLDLIYPNPSDGPSDGARRRSRSRKKPPEDPPQSTMAA